MASLSLSNLEFAWDYLLSSNTVSSQLSQMIPDPLAVDIDARKVGDVILNQQSLKNLQADNRDLINITEPIMQDLSHFIEKDMFVALCEQDGVILLAKNLTSGIICPGVVAERNLVHESILHNGLVELNVCIESDQYINGFFNSVIYPIYDKKNKLQGALSMGSTSRKISDELRVAVFLGASLIENRYNNHQMLKDYSGSLLNSIPKNALLINENGYIENANEQFLRLMGLNHPDEIAGKLFASILANQKKELGAHIIQGLSSTFLLTAADQAIPCSLISTQTIKTPIGNTEHLLVFREDTPRPSSYQLSWQHSCSKEDAFNRLVGDSPQMEEVKRLGRKVAPSSFTVLIEGESGTGKELLAEAIHAASGRSGPFIPINCGAIPRELIQSELFGYKEGAFTGGQKGGKKGKLELADGGTVFLDEIGEMPMDMQVSLLRFLQDKMISPIGAASPKKIDVRVIAATNRNLANEVQNNRFRMDLYYRLNEVNICIPPLRSRKSDIPLLVRQMLSSICTEHHLPEPDIEDPAIEFLLNYEWPGNCRELQNVLKSALVRSSENMIDVQTLQSCFRPALSNHPENGSLQEIEKQVIKNRLIKYNGNISQTARSLKINRSTLYRKIEDYNIIL